MMKFGLTILAVIFCMTIRISAFIQEKPKVFNNEDFSANLPAGNATKEDLKDLLITMERTACFGGCPVYKLTISGTGTVIYEGKEFVNIKGKKTLYITSEQIKQLKAEIDKAKYNDFKDRYEGGPPDSATVIITITIGGKKKSVNHYLASPESPYELKELEDKIDEIVNVYQWIQ